MPLDAALRRRIKCGRHPSGQTVGDMVFAHDPETGMSGPREVLATWPRMDTLVEFEVGASTVTTTEDHEFWNVTDQAWQETQHIDAGDLLLTADGATVEAGTLLWDTAHVPPAFDLTIDEIHAYHVTAGDESVLVHNNTRCIDQLDERSAIAGSNSKMNCGAELIGLSGASRPKDNGNNGFPPPAENINSILVALEDGTVLGEFVRDGDSVVNVLE